MKINPRQLDLSKDLTMDGGRILVESGTSESPGIAFRDFPLTGLFPSSSGLSVVVQGESAIDINVDGVLDFKGPRSISLPSGNSAERPAPQEGMIRFNSQNNHFEGVRDDTWISFPFFDELSSENITEGSNLFFTPARARVSIDSVSPLSYNSSTGVISLVGLTSTGSSNQIIGSNSAGNALEYKTITGGQGIQVTNTPGSMTISSSVTSKVVNYWTGLVDQLSGNTTHDASNLPTVSTGTLLWSVTLSPTGTSSRFFINYQAVCSNNSGSRGVAFMLFRNNMNITNSLTVMNTANRPAMNGVSFTDFPNTTSPITYSLRVATVNGTGVWAINQSNNNSLTFGGNNQSSWTILELIP